MDSLNPDRQAAAKLVELIQEAIDSGPPILVDDAFWEEKKRRLIEWHRANASITTPYRATPPATRAYRGGG